MLEMGAVALETNLQTLRKVFNESMNQSINQFSLFRRKNKMGKYTQQYKY